MGWSETAAFTIVIGAQFLAAIFLTANRHRLYGDTNQESARDEAAQTMRLDRQAVDSGSGRF